VYSKSRNIPVETDFMLYHTDEY